MSWILFAVIGHLLNAIAFIIDKVLLTAAFKRSGTYAALIGSISLLALLASPWVHAWPPLALLPLVVAFGSIFVFALWAFFEALKHGEASRVVPVIGSAIPLFTLLGSSILLHERFSSLEWLGFFLLLIATSILSSGSTKQRLSRESWGFGLLSASLFAISSLCGKYAFDHGSFLGIFVISRAAAGVTGIMIGLSVPGVIYELLTMGAPTRSSNAKRKTAPSHFSKKTTALLALIGQGCGALGFVGVTLALSQGSAPLVNALQATQYALIVLVAWCGGSRMRALMHEERTARVILMKTIAILFVGIGLACIARS